MVDDTLGSGCPLGGIRCGRGDMIEDLAKQLSCKLSRQVVERPADLWQFQVCHLRISIPRPYEPSPGRPTGPHVRGDNVSLHAPLERCPRTPVRG